MISGILDEWLSNTKGVQTFSVLSVKSPFIKGLLRYREIIDGFFAVRLVTVFPVEKRILALSAASQY